MSMTPHHHIDPNPETGWVDFAESVRQGLSSRPRIIPPWFWYDESGSHLFDAICDTEEYYLTRVETEILTRSAPEIAALCGGGPLDLVDLGCGDGRKTTLIVRSMLEHGLPVRYVPVDISEAAVDTAAEAMASRFPGLEIAGLVAEYSAGIEWLARSTERSRLVTFLGSNIGNFPGPEAKAFLRRLVGGLRAHDRLLVGFDLRKPCAPLLAAYNDPNGVGARFTINLLARINKELGGQFDLSRFETRSTYDPVDGTIRMYIISLEPQRVPIAALDTTIEFDAYDPIQVGFSYKFRPAEVTALAADVGVEIDGVFHDEKRWFCDVLWRVPG